MKLFMLFAALFGVVPAAGQPNVLVFLVDDVGWQDTSVPFLHDKDGKPVVTDGPFAETREQLGGFFLIEAKDSDEALAIVAQWPGARVGIIEVRPVEEALRVEARY